MNSFVKSTFLTLSLLLVPANTVHTIKIIPSLPPIAATPGNAAKLTALAFFIWSGVVYINREPTNKPSRYSWDEIFEGKDLYKNFNFLIRDGLIGHGFKAPSIRTYPGISKISSQLCEAYDDINPDTNHEGHIILRPGAYPKGLYGWGLYYLKPTITMIAILATIKENMDKIENGFGQWSDYLDIVDAE